jgi:transcriptional regulator with XRE-family HTH domain
VWQWLALATEQRSGYISHMPVTERLGEALKLLRSRRGWPQKQVAALAGITRGMVSSYEKGRQTPILITLERLLKALDADLCDLYCALEFVNGRQPVGHDLSPRFQPGQAKPLKAAARQRTDDAGEPREPGDDTRGAPQLSADLERALSDTLGGVHRLLRHVLLEQRKPR